MEFPAKSTNLYAYYLWLFYYECIYENLARINYLLFYNNYSNIDLLLLKNTNLRIRFAGFFPLQGVRERDGPLFPLMTLRLICNSNARVSTS
jgi:hypothetical protein